MNYKELSALSNKFEKTIKPSIMQLPTMRVLSSFSKEKSQTSDYDGFMYWLQMQTISFGKPGWHDQFEFQKSEDDVIILKIDDSFVNDSEYSDYIFQGGLFATINCYIDEDWEEQAEYLISYFDENEYYEIDYNKDGTLRQAIMLENLISLRTTES